MKSILDFTNENTPVNEEYFNEWFEYTHNRVKETGLPQYRVLVELDGEKVLQEVVVGLRDDEGEILRTYESQNNLTQWLLKGVVGCLIRSSDVVHLSYVSRLD